MIEDIETARRNRLLEAEITSNEDSDDNQISSDTLSLEKFVLKYGTAVVKKTSGFTLEELDELHSIVADELECVGSGRKGPDTRSRWFAFVIWICSGLTYGKLSALLGCSVGTTMRAINHVYVRVCPPLVQRFVPAKMKLGTRVLKHFPEAKLIVDATLFEIDKPGDRTEAALYCSGKHHKYGTKLQVLVNTDGLCVHMSKLYPGSYHDKKVWDLSGAETFCRLPVSRDEPGIIRHHQLLADGGYQGIAYPEVIMPYRRPRSIPGEQRTQLSAAQIEFNRKLSSDRVLVENFFSRLKGVFGILYSRHRCGVNSMETLVHICVALTNYLIERHPLRLQGELEPNLNDNLNMNQVPTKRSTKHAGERKRKIQPRVVEDE